MEKLKLEDFDANDFILIDKSTRQTMAVPNTLRVNQGSISVSGNIGDELQGDDESLIISIRYSPDKNAFLLEKADRDNNGYAFSRKGNGSAILNSLPAVLKELKPTRGVYTRVSDDSFIFVLSQEDSSPEDELNALDQEAKYYHEDPSNIEKFDIVSYMSRPGELVTGVVEEISMEVDGEKKANLRIINKDYLKMYPSKFNKWVKFNKLILREKYDGR